MREALTHHWPEYLMEAAGLGIFMLSACAFTTLLEHPTSPVRQAVGDPVLRRILLGLSMGCTAVSLIYSPWGKQSRAHLNPSVTLTFLRLGKVAPWDALLYIVAQFVGGVTGVLLAVVVFGQGLADPNVNYVATLPGAYGVGVAFVAGLFISCILMTVVLTVSNSPHLARYTGLCAGVLVALYITVEAPLSGMSMNPARTFGSGLAAHVWTALWIYCTAPLCGMLLAAELYLRWPGTRQVVCAKLHHYNDKRCIFRCGYQAEPIAYAG